MTTSNKTEQKKNDSVQNAKSDVSNQQNQSSPANQGTASNSKGDANQKIPESQNLDTSGYNMSENVPVKIKEQFEIVEGLDSLITENKDRRFFLQELTKPIPRAQRKSGKKSPITDAQRKTARIEIKNLGHDIILLEENRRTAMAYLTKLINDGRTTIDDQKIRARSQSDFYLKRNRTNILNNLVSVLNEARADSLEEVRSWVRTAKRNGSKARDEFQNMFLDFLKKKRYPLYILCTGKESFKKDILSTLRKSFKTWNPNRADLTL